MDIVVWLRALGLERYEAAFRENDIDDTVLPRLTAEDLKELGVGSLGHRRKLLDAIAALRTDTGVKAPSADTAAASTAPSISPEDRAERRQVTVMFSDLVGSTALSARMDPEDLREVISTYQKCVADTVRHGDTVEAKLDKLDVLLSQSATPRKHAALLAEMLSLPNDGRYPAVELEPQQRRQKTMEALTALLEALARANPVLMIFEDVHWIDPTSLEVLGRTVDRLKTLRVLLTITYRPEFEPPWVGRPNVTALSLNRLGEREIAAMIDRVAGNNPLSETARQDIIERTDGIPLFVEEMTKAVLEAENEGGALKTAAAVPSSAIAVPASLHASLMARLDRLGSAKEVAQIGAAIGREFSHTLLAAVALKKEKELQSALDALTRAGLLFRQGVPPSATYLFKHALVQDAAYGTLLREPRRALHAHIADVLESQFPDVAENQPELLARHCTEARLIEKAITLWSEAGRRSMARSALVEAAEQFGRALQYIKTIPVTPALRREQISLQVALITPLIHVKGYAAEETKAAAEEARALIEAANAAGEPPDDPLLLFSVLYAASAAHYVDFKGKPLREYAPQVLTVAERQGDSGLLTIAHRIMGHSLFFTGDLIEGHEHYNRGLLLHRPGNWSRSNGDRRRWKPSLRYWRLWREPINWIPLRLSQLATAHSVLGHSDEAWHYIQEALATVERTMEKWCEAEVNRVAGELVLVGSKPNAAKAEAYFDRALSVARQQQAKSWELRATMSLARLWRDEGKVQQARELLAPVYGWFTEGFETRDLKEAKALLEELAVTTVTES